MLVEMRGLSSKAEYGSKVPFVIAKGPLRFSDALMSTIGATASHHSDQAYFDGNLFRGCTLGPACNQNVECAL